MIEASETVQADLLADAELQTVIEGKHYWELAPKNAKSPLITFRLSETPRRSKDGLEIYGLEVRCFDSTLTKAAQLADLTKAALIKAKHRYQGATSGYVDNEAQEGFVELNFNFNL